MPTSTCFTVSRVICSRDSSASAWDTASESSAICLRNSSTLDRHSLSLASNAAINDGTTPPRPTRCFAARLLHLLRPDTLVLWDKGFDGNGFLAAVTATRAQFLGRLRSNRRTPVLARLADGSYLSVIGTVKVRVIDAQTTVTCADGTVFTGSYHLATPLTDPRRHPAAVLVHFAAVGLIGRRVLADLLPPRRQRVSTRKVESPISRYSERQGDGRPDASRTVTDLDITVLEPPDPQPVLPTRSRDDRHTAPTQRRRHRLPGPAPGRPHPSPAPPRHRRTLRGRHPGHHGWTALPMGRDRTHPQDRPRPLRRHHMDANSPCMTCENANYPALGEGPSGRAGRGWAPSTRPGRSARAGGRR
jgi:hypothetical protein